MVACHGVGETLPSVLSLSLSPPLLCLPLSSFPGPVPAWFLEPSPDGEEDRPWSRRPWEPTPERRGQPARAPRLFPFLRGLHTNSLSHFPPLGWRGSLGRPVGVAGIRATSIDRCPVMEVGTLVRVPDAPQAAPDQAGGYQIPVSIRGGTYWALVDSGCNQTSIHQSLIQPEALDKSCMVRVRCVHGDVVTYPVVLLTIQFRGQKHKVEVAVNPRLRHPLILGTNWPAFKILLGVLCVDASCGKEKPEGRRPCERERLSQDPLRRHQGTERGREANPHGAWWFSPGAVPGRVAEKRVRPGPFHWRPASPVRTAPFLSLFCYIKR